MVPIRFWYLLHRWFLEITLKHWNFCNQLFFLPLYKFRHRIAIWSAKYNRITVFLFELHSTNTLNIIYNSVKMLKMKYPRGIAIFSVGRTFYQFHDLQSRFLRHNLKNCIFFEGKTVYIIKRAFFKYYGSRSNCRSGFNNK